MIFFTGNMSLWDVLPPELQIVILVQANQLLYNDVVAQFKLVMSSIDARLAAHHNVPKESRFRTKTTVFACSYVRRHQGYNYYQRYYMEAYDEFELTFSQESFGNKGIDNVLDRERRTTDLHKRPLYIVLDGVKSREVTVDDLRYLLQQNKIKFLKKHNKQQLVRKFVAIE